MYLPMYMFTAQEQAATTVKYYLPLTDISLYHWCLHSVYILKKIATLSAHNI